MSGFSSSRDELLASLRSYTSALRERNDALAQLSRTSTEMRNVLQSSECADIDGILKRRDNDCQMLAGMRGSDTDTGPALIEAAARAAADANDDMAKLARLAVSLHTDSQALTQNILSCQSECEAVLKSRLEATAKAIRQSRRRRKLDAAYGPAYRHDTPSFLDRQQ